MEGCAVPVAMGIIVLAVIASVWVIKALIAWPNASLVAIGVLLGGALLVRVTADY